MLHKILTGHPETIARLAVWLLMASLCHGFVCVRYDAPGILTVMQTAAMGISAVMFSGYRRERGLWMHATLYLLLYASVHGLGLYGEMRDGMRGVAPPLTILIDATLATFVLGIHVKLLWNVGTANFRFFRE